MNEKLTSEQDAVTGEPGAAVPEEGGNLSTAQQTSSGGLTAEKLLYGGAWLLAISAVLFTAYLSWRLFAGRSAYAASVPTASGPASTLVAVPASQGNLPAGLPAFDTTVPSDAVLRRAELLTIIPNRPREDVITYTVTTGDSVFEIARNFNLKPESLLWANYATLKDNPEMLSPGMVLNVPPTDGVYAEVQDGENLDAVAAKYKAKSTDIINWPGNHLDLTKPEVKSGDWVMVPGGKREFVQWVIPTIPRGRAGVSKTVLGPGACEGGYSGAYGTGFFIWPSSQHVLSGNDYWSGHLGIDIAGMLGDGVVAADSGVVVFAGWSYGGYGNMIMIDHGNGYQTLYGHLSSVGVSCGRSVIQGGYIGAIGSTGNSTGAHLHFEVRYGAGFINPWTVLP